MKFLLLLLAFTFSCEALIASPTTVVARAKASLLHSSAGNTCLHLSNNDNDQHSINRRNVLSALLVTTASTVLGPLAANAIDLQPSPEDPKITHKVTFNVRISRADGTFYTRDEPADTLPTPDNQVFTGAVTVGLYGDLAPNHVQRFLNYVDVLYSPADDTPLPSYARSQFSTLDQSTGLLAGGNIPGLHLSNFAGSSALEYGGRILPSKLWVDDFKGKKRMFHSRPGLLTHRDLEVLPNFGITTRPSSELNAGNTVFGTLLPTESSIAFLSRCVDLPTYSLDRPAGPIGEQQNSRAVEEAASSVYAFQKNLFRSAAQTFGDTRVGSVYEGKILRRVEVTSVSSEKA